MGGELGTRMITTPSKKKKKKGRPSLLDLERRSIKQQQNQFRNRNPKSILKSDRQPTSHQPPTFTSNNDDDYDDDDRQQKKHKTVQGLELDNFTAINSVYVGRSKICAGSDHMEKVLKATDTLQGSPVESAGPTTPLPDKKLLVFVLDRLQKKDTNGVFSEPVDPEELPDYHEIIAQPIDFATVRKRLDAGVYSYLEEFEKDVFLICSNAMQYNAPDTIYFRQARSILELAKKDFENLRQDSDDSEPQPQPKVVRRGRPPKNLKRSLPASPPDLIASEFISDATLATRGDNSICASPYNLRKGPITSDRFQPPTIKVSHGQGSRVGVTNTSWLSEWENEFPAHVLKAVLKYGKKHFTVDENRRETYKDCVAAAHEQPVLTTFKGELKQLMAVGLNSEYGYARSLAQFAADLGPVAWKVASLKIQSVLPIGVKFGPGWVGENKPTEQQQYLNFEKQKSSNNYVSGAHHSSKLLSPTTSGSNSIAGNRYSLRSGEDMEAVKEVNSQSSSSISNICCLGGMCVSQIQSRPFTHTDVSGFSSGGSGREGFGFNDPNHMGTMGLARAPQNSRSDNSPVPSQMFGTVMNNQHGVCPIPAGDYDSSAAGKLADSSSSPFLGSGYCGSRTQDTVLQRDSSWQDMLTLNKQEHHTFAPDLNVRFLAPDPPISNIQIGWPHQQPDLALQL